MTAHTSLTSQNGSPDLKNALTVAVVTGGIPHYRWPFFSELADRGVDLHLIAAGSLPAGIIATAPPDARIAFKRLSPTRSRWRVDVIRELERVKPDVVLLEHGAALDYCWTTLLARGLKAPRILWTHGIARQELYGGKRGPASWGRWMQLGLADGIVCYDAQMAEQLRLRFPRKVVGAAPNSTDGVAIVAERLRCESEGQDSIRRKLGLSAQFYLAGLGRLVKDKEFARLLRVTAVLRQSGLDVGVILIGGGPEESTLRRVAEASGLQPGRDVVFTGALGEGASIARWLYASDACVSPGFLGLSVADSLFAGLPVISFEPSKAGPHHSPEWLYLTRETTGFFATEPHDDALAATCREFLSRSAAARRATREACATYAAGNLGVKPMADGMFEVIRSVRQRARIGNS